MKSYETDLNQIISLLGLAEHLRMLLVSRDQRTHALMEISDRLRVRYFEQASSTPISLLLTGLQIANECDIHYSRAKNKRLHVEMALLKMCHIHRMTDQEVTALHPKKKTIVDTGQNQVFDLPEPGINESNAPIPVSGELQGSKHSPYNTLRISCQKKEQSLKQIFRKIILNPEKGTEPSTQEQQEEPVSGIPTLSSLKHIQQKILSKNTQKQETMPFTLETVQTLWNDYRFKCRIKVSQKRCWTKLNLK